MSISHRHSPLGNRGDGEIHFFYEDVVYRVNRKGQIEFGLVVENSEFATSDEEDDDEEKLKPGFIRVLWHPKAEECVVREKRVRLADRSLMPGDVVRRLIKDRQTQRGYCRTVQVSCCLQIVGTQQVVYGVPSQLLMPLEEFALDVAVSMGPWVGMIRQITTDVIVKFADGSTCRMADNIADLLEDAHDKRDRECEYRAYGYYASQELCGPLSIFKAAEFSNITIELSKALDGKGLKKMVKVTVEKVETVGLRIQWQCHGFLAEQDAMEPPGEIVSGDDMRRVKMLNVFEPCTLQIGDRKFLKLRDNDVIMAKDDWRNLERDSYQEPAKEQSQPKTEGNEDEDGEEDVKRRRKARTISGSSNSGNVTFNVHRNRQKKLKASKRTQPNVAAPVMKVFNPGEQVVVEVVSTRTEASIVWQDGSIEECVASRELFPVLHLDDQEFFCGDFVIRNEPKDAQVYGIVQSVDHLNRTCKVKWFKTYTSGEEPSPLEDGESEEPVYDLKDHPDFKYRPGSIVIRVANFSQGQSAGGQVMDNYPCGKVMVWWANNETSVCWPQDLYKIGEYDSDEGELWEDEEDLSSDDSWETESEHSVVVEQKNQVPEDEKMLRPKLAQNIEKLRLQMAKLEEIFQNSHRQHPSGVIKHLLDIYADCRNLDQLMKTDFFNEDNFDGLIDKVKEIQQDSKQCHQKALKDQVKRLFSKEEAEVDVHSQNNVLYAQFCNLMKCQLIKSHEVAANRCGGQTFTAEDLVINSLDDELDLGELMAKVLLEKEPPSSNMKGSASNQEISAVIHGQSPSVAAAIPEAAEDFSIVETAPADHKFKLSLFQPNDPKSVVKFVRREMQLLRTSLPPGIHVRGFEDRMDLYSVMIKGPEKTPYEDGLFFFDFQLSPDYPVSPPLCHYYSYVKDRLNPNLYEDGKVCVSLLGTWSGKGTETWTQNSNLLQLLVSIQGLILVNEPYFNEAGYERQKGTQHGSENSRMYNEMVLLKLVQALTRLVQSPPKIFKDEVIEHFKQRGQRLVDRLETWRSDAKEMSEGMKPHFPLLPASKGFCISLQKALQAFRESLEALV